ncbi:hypothetical protein ISS85_03345 [Candidatus Microgenomates bacterium]|nr:hypothetical protein [Candidatus Microgenomates bacterium]
MPEDKPEQPRGLPQPSKEPASLTGNKEGAPKSPPKITKEQARKAIDKASAEAQKKPKERTPQEALKVAKEAVEAIVGQPEVAPQLEFLKGAPVLSEEAFASVILELVAEVNRRKIETDPDFLVRKAAELKEIARKTGVGWTEALGFIKVLNAKAKEIANKQPWIGERMYGLQITIDEIEESPKPLPSKSLFEPKLEERLSTLSVLPEESKRRILSFNERFKAAPQGITTRDFEHLAKYAFENINDMKQREDESGDSWKKRHGQAYEEVEQYLDAISPRLAELLGSPPGTRERFDRKIHYSRKFAENFLNPKNHQLREDEFYAILSEIIGSREESVRDLYGLYERAEISAFMTAVGSMPGVGKELARHYKLLQRAIMQCHDIDYYAGDPHGDVKSFVTSAALFRNEYWVEAHKDPLTETAMRCYYQALMMLRDNNNGFIPAWLVEGGYLDDLAANLFIQRIKMKQLYEVARKEDGTPILNKYHKPVLDEKKTLEFKDIWDDKTNGLNNRARAVLKIAKGCNIIQLHFLEIIAYSRVPMVDKDIAVTFASKPYEGLARWINWTGDLAGKYSWGETLHLPFFNILAERDKTKWTQSEAKKVIEAAAEGRMEEVFGEDAQRLIDVVDMGRICGWGGPQSKWRMLDATHYWDDKQKETLGAGIWLTYAGAWAEGEVRKKVVDEKYRREFREHLCKTAEFPEKEEDWEDGDWQLSEIKWLEHGMQKEVYGGKIEREWEKIKKQKKATYIEYVDGKPVKRKIKNIKDEIKEMAQIYKTKAIIQMVMRNPTRAASECEFKRDEVPGAPSIKRTLRDKIVQDILGINLYELSGSYMTKPGTPTQEMLEKQGQVAEVEGAINALHEKTVRYVLNERGELVADMQPRDLEDKDFEAIPEHGEKVRDLRQKAKDYWEEVKKEILGEKWSVEDWEKELFANPKNRFKTVMVGRKKEERYVFKKGLKIEEVLKSGATPSFRKLLKKEWAYLFAPEDISWGLLDTMALGGRHPLRRAGDFGAYIEGVKGLGLFVDGITGQPDFDDLLKQLKAAKEGFKGYDPNVGYKACYRFADAMLKLYDKAGWAQIPGVGDYLKAIKPSSIAKEVYGITNAIDLGANEKKEITDKIAQMNILPAQDEIYGKHFEYNAEKLARENNATTAHQIFEMILRGSLMVAGAMAFAALTAKEEEE